MTQTPPEPLDVQRVLMDRAQRMAERDLVPPEDLPFTVVRLLLKPGTWYEDQRDRFKPFNRLVEPDPVMRDQVALALALLVVVIVLFAFDRFLASVQRFLAIPVTAPALPVTEPLPAYVVPAEQPAPATDGQRQDP